MATADTVSTFDYSIDDDNRLTHVSREWEAFAVANGVPDLALESVRGRSIFEFIHDRETRELYRLLLDRVRKTGRAVVVQFRCDSAELRRFMELSIAPEKDGELSLTGRLIREETRSPVPLFDPDLPRSESFLTVCSWCKHVRVGDAWIEVEDAVVQLGLFDGDCLPQLSHGICPTCDKHVREKLKHRAGR